VCLVGGKVREQGGEKCVDVRDREGSRFTTELGGVGDAHSRVRTCGRTILELYFGLSVRQLVNL
jgi:hypothetical protein